MTNRIILSTSAVTPQLDSQVDFFLIDGSSSMCYDAEKWWSSMSAIDAYIDGIKTHNLNTRILLTVFDSTDMEYTARDTKLTNWVPLNTDPVGAHGGTTPLYDAINLMGRRLRDLNPPRASIVIVTDGEENASRFTNLTQAKAILDWMRGQGWQVTFIGCDFNNTAQSSLLGASPQSAIGVSKANMKAAVSALADKRRRYSQTGEPMHYTDEEKSTFGGYLG